MNDNYDYDADTMDQCADAVYEMELLEGSVQHLDLSAQRVTMFLSACQQDEEFERAADVYGDVNTAYNYVYDALCILKQLDRDFRRQYGEDYHNYGVDRF